MQIENEELKKLVRKKLLLNIIAEILLIVGGILAMRPSPTWTVPIIGVFIFGIGFGIGIRALVLRNSKKYKELEKNEPEYSDMDSIVGEFGMGMTIMGLIFIFAMIIAGVWIFYAVSHSWIKVIFFVLAFELVTDLRDYFKLINQKN